MAALFPSPDHRYSLSSPADYPGKGRQEACYQDALASYDFPMHEYFLHLAHPRPPPLRQETQEALRIRIREVEAIRKLAKLTLPWVPQEIFFLIDTAK